MTQITGNVTATTVTYATANILTNGDFETGTIVPWQLLQGTTATVGIDYASEGTYGASLWADGVYTAIFQEIAYASTLTLNYKFATYGENNRFVVSDTYVEFEAVTPEDSEWHPLNIEINDVITDGLNLTIEDNGSSPAALWLDSIYAATTTDNVSSATIEDSSKTWTADQLNDGTFILRSGSVTGYATKITDTFGNYIQVATTFANIINNITSGTSYHTATVQIDNPDFSTGDFTDWSSECTTECTGDEFATIYITSSTKQSGSYAVCGELRAGDPTESTYFTLAPTTSFDVTDITYVSFYYNITNIVRGGNVYLQVSVATAGDGEGNPVTVSETYTAQTDGWVRGLLNVATLTGNADLTITGKCPLPDW